MTQVQGRTGKGADLINVLQHVGIAVSDRDRSWAFYRRLGFDVPMTSDQSYITRLKPLTGGDYERKVVLAGNLMGGATIEIFQFTSTEPVSYSKDWQWGDPGITAMALKVPDLVKALELFKETPDMLVAGPAPWSANPAWKAALLKDPDGLLIYFVEIPGMNYSLRRSTDYVGGIVFASIAVSDMERSLDFYRQVLDYTDVLYDWNGTDPMLSAIPGGERPQRRVMLSDPRPSTSFFSFYLDRGMIELVEVEGSKAPHIFHGRRWGDIGKTEICFDVYDIRSTFEELVRRGAEPVIEPNLEDRDLGLGVSALFGYLADPDGTLIELSEPTRLRLIRKISLDLRKRKPGKAFPAWIMKLSRFNRYKE
ncbi:hypothetical protein ES703_25748 [subsurface metagenome]